MKTLNEWIVDRGLSSHYAADLLDQDDNDDLLASQLEQYVTRIEGLCHGLSEEQKSELLDKFMRSLEERILGL